MLVLHTRGQSTVTPCRSHRGTRDERGARFALCNNNLGWPATARVGLGIRRRDRCEFDEVEGMVGTAHRSAQSRADILLIMTDDSGFGVPSTFGGVIPTPTMDRIAKSGLRHNNIHSTALCSPTLAALITGRNHHSAGFGVISGAVDRLPGLQQHHCQRQGHDRPHFEGQWICHVMVR